VCVCVCVIEHACVDACRVLTRERGLCVFLLNAKEALQAKCSQQITPARHCHLIQRQQDLLHSNHGTPIA
jgi:hypothetical protein